MGGSATRASGEDLQIRKVERLWESDNTELTVLLKQAHKPTKVEGETQAFKRIRQKQENVKRKRRKEKEKL